jgi:S1-C subfamily serine protease
MKFLFFILLIVSFKGLAQNSLPDLIEKTKQSIVAVGTFTPKKSPSSVFLGTGFAIGDGKIIVTNAHVIPNKINVSKNETIAVFFRQNNQLKRINAQLIALDKTHDIALLQLQDGKLPALAIDVKRVREGQTIIFTGFPIGTVLGLYPVTHKGIISTISPIVIPQHSARQLNAKLLRRLRNPFLVYQLDATAYPGNSGSPVINIENGGVIGIINKVFIKESKENVLSKPSGITYAIPIEYLNDLLRKYKKL